MLATKPERKYHSKEDLHIDENPKKINRKKNKRSKRKKKKSSAKLTYIITAMVVLGISLLILSRYAQITLVRTEITKLEEEKIQLEKTKTNLIAELEGIKSSRQIGEDASVKLGMDYPTESQIAYISLKEKKVDVDDKNIIEKIKGVFIE